jgi:4,5-DOPA dioxygenase extradiol
MLPSIFVSHGAPTLPLDDVPARDFLMQLPERFEKPKAIVIATGHWETKKPMINAVAVNETIHDFYGFPENLYRLKYPAPGDFALSNEVQKLLSASGIAASLDIRRGLDHGAWVPLMLMYPDADIPVVQVAVLEGAGAAGHIALGRALASLRKDGVLVMGSGGYVHNLREVDLHQPDAQEPGWVREFSDWMHAALKNRSEDDLANYRARAPHAVRAQPTEDHFMPLFVAYGAGGGTTERLHASTTFGTLRMDAYAFA